ncbi:MAG: mechanosensitive ion channel [Alphaproteobacteria bacterium]
MNSEQVQEIIDQVVDVVAVYGLNVIGALAILIIGWIAAGWARSAAERALGRIKAVDDTLRPFLASLVRYVILAFVVVAVLEQFGFETTSLIALIGAAGLAIGLALQGTLSNLAAGVMLLMFRPFKVGQYIDAGGNAGTVKSVNLFTTDLTTPDNVLIIVPNKDLWNTSIKNFNAFDTRRLDFLLGIGYGDDINKAFEVIQSILNGDDRCQKEPASLVAVSALGDSSVNITVRVWCAGSDYWALKWDLTKAFKEGLDSAGIEIPFPQRTVHLINETPAESK